MIKTYTILLGNFKSKLPLGMYKSISDTPAKNHSIVITNSERNINPYPTAFPYGNGTVLHFYQQQKSSTTKTVHKVINKGLKAYV